jgi:hypothetical protein
MSDFETNYARHKELRTKANEIPWAPFGSVLVNAVHGNRSPSITPLSVVVVPDCGTQFLHLPLSSRRNLRIDRLTYLDSTRIGLRR